MARTPAPSSPRRHAIARELARPFRNGSHAWLVVFRNAVPVVGVHFLGWSSGIVVLTYWLDGASAVGALVASIVPSVVREKGSPFGHGRLGMAGGGILAWALGVSVLGIPFAFALVMVMMIVDASVWTTIASDPWIWFGFASVVAGNAMDIIPRGYASMPEAESRRALQWEFMLLLARAAAFLLVAAFLRAGILIPFALALCFIQIYPLRALKFLDLPVDADDVPASQRDVVG